jgi:hypothetical protein
MIFFLLVIVREILVEFDVVLIVDVLGDLMGMFLHFLPPYCFG